MDMLVNHLAFVLFCVIIKATHAQSTNAKYGNVTVSAEENSFNGFSIVEQVQSFGYPVEVHSDIPTEDDYLITAHRIPHGKDGTINGTNPVVFLMHGMGTSADCWVAMGPQTGLAFLLADHGYDVWMGNARGTFHSRKHKYLDPDVNYEYWDFSWHEIGYYDLPAYIYYILDVTGQSRLTFIGHSQGGTTFYVMSSSRPEMNRFIKLVVGLAPGVMYGIEGVALPQHEASLLFQVVEDFCHLMGINEVGPQLREVFCHFPVLTEQICDFAVLATVGILVDIPQFNMSNLSTAKKILPNSLSVRQALHYFQVLVMADFRQYDFGPAKNLRKYGRTVPPSYDLSKATPPAALFSGFADFLVTSFNVDRLARTIPNTVLNYKVPLIIFNHLDFVVAKEVVELLYNKVLEVMDQYVDS